MKHVKKALYYMLFTLVFGSCAAANNAKITHDLLESTPQDCARFIKDPQQADKPVVDYDPTQVMESFLRYYFSPWENPFQAYDCERIYVGEQEKIQRYLQNPGWGLNKHPHSPSFIAEVNNNVDLSTFPNFQQRAIVTQATDLRDFPCNQPSFTDWVSAGEGYPFDNWQESLLAPNEPVYILHTSKDKAWHFVLTGSCCCGWVQRGALAYVTPEFIAKWRTGRYVTPMRDGTMVIENLLAPLGRVGQLMPLAQGQNNTDCHQVLTVMVNQEGYAEIKPAVVAKSDVTAMPLLATPNNMARIANSLMGQPYGWGGLEGYRDCSALLKDILMPFGIWLPRNSGAQAKAGTFVSLEGLKADQKEKSIIEQGVPFFTLIWLPGHIVMYLGAQQEKVYVYNDIWGLRTRAARGKEGRAVLGRVVVMPIDFGKEYSNIKKTVLDKTKGMVQLTNRLVDPDAALALFKKVPKGA